MMHQDIMGAKGKQVVDHINKNGLDNRRCNLRVCTVRQNAQNHKRFATNTSGYTGVNLEGKKWRARLRGNDSKKIHVGNFNTPEEAAVARDKKALELRGEFACLNFPDNDL